MTKLHHTLKSSQYHIIPIEHFALRVQPCLLFLALQKQKRRQGLQISSFLSFPSFPLFVSQSLRLVWETDNLGLEIFDIKTGIPPVTPQLDLKLSQDALRISPLLFYHPLLMHVYTVVCASSSLQLPSLELPPASSQSIIGFLCLMLLS